MPNYYWKGIDTKGMINSGTLQSKSRQTAFQQLAANNITPIRISHYFFHRSVTQSMILDFTQQLSLLLTANIPLEKSLQVLEKSEKWVAAKISPQMFVSLLPRTRTFTKKLLTKSLHNLLLSNYEC